jgi:hypothetical protein
MLVMPNTKDNPKKEINDLLSGNGIKVDNVETELIDNTAVVWVTTAQEKKAKTILTRKDIKSFTSDVIIIKLPDKPGELAKIARILSSSDIVVKDAHLILKDKRHALYGITTNKPREAAKIVEKVVDFMEKEDKEKPAV